MNQKHVRNTHTMYHTVCIVYKRYRGWLWYQTRDMCTLSPQKKKETMANTVSRITIKHLIVRLVHFNFFSQPYLVAVLSHTRQNFKDRETAATEILALFFVWANMAKFCTNHLWLGASVYHYDSCCLGHCITFSTPMPSECNQLNFEYIIINY